MRIDTSEPSLLALFEKGQVGLIRTEFMRKDDVIAALIAENADLKKYIDFLERAERLSIYDTTTGTWKKRFAEPTDGKSHL